MSCGDRDKRSVRPGMPMGTGSIMPANMNLEQGMYVGYKVKAKPVKYNAVFMDLKSTVKCEEGFSGWMVSILGAQIFVAEDDMINYFELIEEMEIPFEDEMSPEMREEYKRNKLNK